MDYSTINVNEHINVSGGIDIWTHNPPQHEPTNGFGSLLGAILGIGAIFSLFTDKEPKQIVHVHPPQPLPLPEQKSDTFELVFCLLDRAKNILRKETSKEELGIVAEFLDSVFSFLKKDNLVPFSELEYKILDSVIKDLLILVEDKNS